MNALLEVIENGRIDDRLSLWRVALDVAPEMYKVWCDKEQSVTKMVIDPWTEKKAA